MANLPSEQQKARKREYDRLYYFETVRNDPAKLARRSAKSREWGVANSAKLAARSKRYKEGHRKEIAAKMRAAYQLLTVEQRRAIGDGRREYLKNYREQHRDSLSILQRNNYDKEAQHSLYRKNYEAKRQEYIARADDRQRKLRSRGSHSQEDIDAMYVGQRGICNGCGVLMANSRDRRVKNHYEVDHVMPVSLGGMNTADNLQLLCCPCNRRKHAMHPDDWVARVGKST